MQSSIIIPTFNRISQLKELLDSLNQQTDKHFEVIIVDDTSNVEISKVIHKEVYNFKIKIKRNETNLGPGASRNVGIHLAKSDYILFTDDDCILSENWVSEITSSLQNSPENIAGIGGCTLAKENDLFSKYYEFHRILDPKPHDQNFPERIPYLVTANCAIKKDILMKAGGFDCRIPQAGGEDTALSMRIAKLGYYFIRNPKAIVYHQFRKNLKDFFRTFYRYGLGGRYVVDNYLPF